MLSVYAVRYAVADYRLIVRGHTGVYARVENEVKSGKHVASPSARRFAEKYGCPYLIRVSEKNFGAHEGVRSVPLYAACLLGEL